MIEREEGVQRKKIYNKYREKEEMMEEVIDDEIKRMRERIIEVIEKFKKKGENIEKDLVELEIRMR